MANFTWDKWYLYGSGWTTSYAGSGSATITRAAGSSTATVTLSMSMYTIGGDEAGWTYHYKVGNTTGVLGTVSGTHAAGTTYTKSTTVSVSAKAAGGSVSVSLWMTVDGYESYSGGTSATKSANLSYGSIGASTLASVSNTTLGNACNVTWTPYVSTNKFKIKYEIGSWYHNESEFIEPKKATSYTYSDYSIPNISDVWKQITSSKTATMTVTLYSYSSTGAYLGESSKTCTVTVPSSCAPSVKSISTAEAGTTLFSGVYVAGYSKVKATVTASSSYNATISSVRITFGNTTETATYSSGSWTATSGTLSAGTTTITVTATDSRGYTATKTTSVTVKSYSAPGASVDLDVSGTKVTVTAKVKATSMTNSSGTQLNSGSYTLVRKKVSTGASSTVKSDSFTVDSEYQDIKCSETLTDVETESYEYIVTATDKVTSKSASKSTGVVCISRLSGGNGLALFREATTGDKYKIGLQGVNGADAGLDIKVANGDGAVFFGVGSDGTNHGVWSQSLGHWLLYGNDATRMIFAHDQDVSSPTYPHWTELAGGAGSSENAVGLHDYQYGRSIFQYKDKSNKLYIGSNQDIYLDNNYLKDWVTASDTKQVSDSSGNALTWYWRKWKSGIVECWGTYTKAIAITRSWGSMYYGDIGSFSFPVTFKYYPYLITQISAVASGSAWLGIYGSSSMTATPTYEAIRPTAHSGLAVRITIYATQTV